MKFPSFRLRLAILAATLAGIALAGFSLTCWYLIYEAKLKRLDAELTFQIMPTRRLRSPDDWQTYAENLPLHLSDSGNTKTAVIALKRDKTLLYQSASWVQQLDPEILWRSLPFNPPPPDLEPPNDRPPPPPAQTIIATQTTPNKTWRVAAIAAPEQQVAIAVSLEAIDQEMSSIATIFVIAIPMTLILVAAGAWIMSSSALSPIRRLTAAIQTVTVQGLDQRLSETDVDLEFLTTIQVFNHMLERLELSFHQALRFSGDAAHELKTPLAILQGELERSLQQAESGSELQQNLCRLLDEVRHLSTILRKLLLLSLADAGKMNLYRVNLNFSLLLTEILEDLELLAPHLSLQVTIAPNLTVHGDQDLLVQVLQNLIGNAIKYNLPAGWITIIAQTQGTQIMLTIANASYDLGHSDRDRIFDRFHRGHPAQTQKIEGSGLGLSLAREIVRAHQGSLILSPPQPDQTTFILRLPQVFST